METYVNVVFWLTGLPGPVGVSMAESDAKEILNKFNGGTLVSREPVLGSHNVRCSPDTVAWSIATSHLIAINVFTKKQQEAAQAAQAAQQARQSVGLPPWNYNVRS